MKRIALLIALSLTLFARAQDATTGLPAPAYTGVGAPTKVCSATNLAGVAYFQQDATTGRQWICMLAADNVTWSWIHFLSPIAIATTTTITAGTFLLGGCTAVTNVAIAGAVVGTNSATANPIFVTAPTGNIGSFNVTAWVSAAGIVSVQGCAFNALASVPNFQARVLMY